MLGIMSSRVASALLITGLLATTLSSIGCGVAVIPNTDVPDSSKNRRIVSFCEQYRHAVEEKNVGLLLTMAHERYYEDGGNTAPDDDIDYDGLKTYLTTQFIKSSALRYEIRYRRITFAPTERVFVDYTYSASYKVPGLTRDEWRHSVADNRIVLVPAGESFKILSGM